MVLVSTLTASYTYRKGNIWSGYTGLNNNHGGKKWNFYSKIGYRKDNDYGDFTTRKNFSNMGGRNLAMGSFNGLNKSVNLQGGIVFYPNSKYEFGVEGYFNKGTGDYKTEENLIVHDTGLNSVSDNYRTDQSGSRIWYTTLNYTFKKDTLRSTVRFIGDIGENRNETINNTDTRYTYGGLPASVTNYLIKPLSDNFTLQADWHQRVTIFWQFNTGVKYGSVRRSNTLQTSISQNETLILTPDSQERFENKENISAVYFSLSAKSDEHSSFKAGLRGKNTVFSGTNRISGQTTQQIIQASFQVYTTDTPLYKTRLSLLIMPEAFNARLSAT